MKKLLAAVALFFASIAAHAQLIPFTPGQSLTAA